MTIKKTIFSIAAFTLALSAGIVGIARADNDNHDNRNQNDEARLVGSTLEVHITDNGKVLVRGAKVTGVSGTTINTSVQWGSVAMNWNVVTDSNTKFIRRYSGASNIAEIEVGDFISFQGMINTTIASPMTVTATTVKDWSIQRKHGTFEGTVGSVNADAKTFVLTSNNRGPITVTVLSTATITKGGTAGTFADIIAGTTVTASGLYNNLTLKLDADTVKVKLPGSTQTTVQGTLSSIAGTTAPTTFVLRSDNTDYTVRVATDTSILNTLWLHSALTSFAVGNTVRVYGTVNTDHTIDATVVRNTSIH